MNIANRKIPLETIVRWLKSDDERVRDVAVDAAAAHKIIGSRSCQNLFT